MSWEDRVALSDESGGFAYRPREVIAVGAAARDAVASLLEGILGDGVEPVSELTPSSGVQTNLEPLFRFDNVENELTIIKRLRSQDIRVQPNHVFFAAPIQADPVYASPVYASPVYASPVYASPVYASPVYASPVYASGADRELGPVLPHETVDVSSSPVAVNPVYASRTSSAGYRTTGRRLSTARAVEGRHGHLDEHEPPKPRVRVLDTGVTDTAPFRVRSRIIPGRVPQDWRPSDPNDPDPDILEVPDWDRDGYLDPAAGHGTFIAGIIERMAPGAHITLDRAFRPEGDGTEWDIVDHLCGYLGASNPPQIVNLSFSGHLMENEAWTAMRGVLTELTSPLEATGRERTIVVAAAGNEGTNRPTYPAAFPGVIGVGAIGPAGPAPFTNYGHWVRACAPGVELVAPFFTGFQGKLTQHPQDPDDFDGWARWSGTSFAAPVVAGALARQMQRGLSTATSVREVIDHPARMRIPGLGTVVNEH